jgi:hypothetical protein
VGVEEIEVERIKESKSSLQRVWWDWRWHILNPQKIQLEKFLSTMMVWEETPDEMDSEQRPPALYRWRA